MKFEQAEPQFRSVTITLETLEECRAMAGVFAEVGGNEGDDLAYRLYALLSDIVQGDYIKYECRDLGLRPKKKP